MTGTTILAVSFPVAVGLIVWLVQQLVQRSWNHYEQKRMAYIEVISLLDVLFEGGDTQKRPDYLKSVRCLWLIGSDEVVRSVNSLHNNIKADKCQAERQTLYSQVVLAIRRDMHRRVFLPPGRTSLSTEDFPVER